MSLTRFPQLKQTVKRVPRRYSSHSSKGLKIETYSVEECDVTEGSGLMIGGIVNESVIPNIANRIFLIRGQKVMLDEDLAKIYGVSTKRLNQQVQRNKERFPSDFMFQLTVEEIEILRLHFATLRANSHGKHRKYLPYAFTEHGAVMVSAVLKTFIAVQASIQIARAFIQLRRLLGSHKELANKLETLEKRYDTQFITIFDAIRELRRQTSGHRKLSPPIRGFINE